MSAAKLADQRMPQVLPVLQAADDEPKEKEELLPVTFEANVETFFFTSTLWQSGQTTPSTMLELRTSSSNWLPHWLQINSNNGIQFLLDAYKGYQPNEWQTVYLDAETE